MSQSQPDASGTRQIRRLSNPRICGGCVRPMSRVAPTHIASIPACGYSDPRMPGADAEITPLLSKSLIGVLGRSTVHTGQNLEVVA